MHGDDINVIVRTLTGDDPKQAEQARAVTGQTPVFVPRTVLLEVEWVTAGRRIENGRCIPPPMKRYTMHSVSERQVLMLFGM